MNDNYNKVDLHKMVLDELHHTYVFKNSDYGDSVHNTYLKYGPTSLLVRMEDKMNRLESLVKKSEHLVEDEKLEDTLLDLANYAILFVMELKNDEYHEHVVDTIDKITTIMNKLGE